jgi:hypothetical protein
VRALGFCFALIVTQAVAEESYYLDGVEVVIRPSSDVKNYIKLKAVDFAIACDGYLRIKAALSDFASVSQFPLSVSEYPVADIKSGLFQLGWAGVSLGYEPSLHSLIWDSLAGAEDKELGREERDNILALWIATEKRMPLNCEEGS